MSCTDFEIEEDETPKVSRDNALKQVHILIKKYGINVKKLDKKEKKATVACLELITDGIMRGAIDVSINESSGQLEVAQFLEHRSKGSTVEKLVYGERESKSHIAMGESDNEYERTNLFMVSICITENAGIIIPKLRLTDVDIKNALAGLFS